MTLQKLDQLTQQLVQHKLIESNTLTQCLQENLFGNSESDQFLNHLESKHLLTSYQVNKIRQGEIDGLVLGDYKLMYRNASGSFARVFRACSVSTGQMVGLKVLRQRWVQDPQMVAMFHREARLGQRLRHKNIVPIYDVDQQGQFHFLSMEFVEGGNLREFMKIRKKLSPEEATRYLIDIAEGLQYALNMGMTHRDMKLTNILMSIHGTAKLVDFGLAGDDHAAYSEETGGDVQRALEYAALEKGTQAPLNDPRTDLFFLGVIYYELLTGKPPYARTRDRGERSRLSRYQSIRPIREIDPSLDRPIEKIAEKLLAINPIERYQSATDLIRDADDLMKYLKGSGHSIASIDSSALAKLKNSGKATILCIENRMKQQDVLRTYLRKHDYRILVVSDLERGLQRVKTEPPDCVIVMASAFQDDEETLIRVSEQLHVYETKLLIVLGKKQHELKPKLPIRETVRLLVQPISLSALREQVEELLGIESMKKN